MAELGRFDLKIRSSGIDRSAGLVRGQKRTSPENPGSPVSLTVKHSSRSACTRRMLTWFICSQLTTRSVPVHVDVIIDISVTVTLRIIWHRSLRAIWHRHQVMKAPRTNRRGGFNGFASVRLVSEWDDPFQFETAACSREEFGLTEPGPTSCFSLACNLPFKCPANPPELCAVYCDLSDIRSGSC